MRRVLAAAFVAATLLCLVPTGEAAINKPRAFHESFAYMPGLDDDSEMTVVSGEVEATSAGAGSFGFFDSAGLTVSGLQKVCYGTTCETAGPYSLIVSPGNLAGDGTRNGGSASLCFPSPAQGDLQAGHVLGLFVDMAQDDDLNSFPVDKSLVAPAVDGVFGFTVINPISTAGNPTAACAQHGGLAALDDSTTIQLQRGSTTVTALAGKAARFAFSGQPVVTDVRAGFYILPFNGGASAEFDAASKGDAREGLDLARVQDLVRKLDQAHQSTTVDRPESETGGSNTQGFLSGLLNGALLRMPQSPQEGESFNLDGSQFIRFSRLTVTGLGGGALDWEGKAYLEVEDGKVVGAKNLVGVWLFQLPWWSYLLWAAALTLAIVRLILKPDKNNPRWDALRWIGWAATAVAWILVFFLWDLEMYAVLGASLLRGSSGQFKLIVAMLQFTLLGLVTFAVAAPLRVIGRNSFMLAHLGTFMGISGSIAAILGFLFGAPYLRAYLGVILDQVMQRLA